MQVPGSLHAFLSVMVVGYLLADLLLREPLLAEVLQRWAQGAGGGGGGRGGATGAGAGPLGVSGGRLLARAVSGLLGAPPAGSVYSYGLSEGLSLSLMWTALVLLLVVSGAAEALDGGAGVGARAWVCADRRLVPGEGGAAPTCRVGYDGDGGTGRGVGLERVTQAGPDSRAFKQPCAHVLLLAVNGTRKAQLATKLKARGTCKCRKTV